MSRKIKKNGVMTNVSLDKNKKYKYSPTGDLVEATGTLGDNEISMSGSKSSLRRAADMERNISILATTMLTTDNGAGVDSPAEVKAAASADATTKANNAKSQAISAASSDATTKANAALASAKSYADQAEADAESAAATDATTKANNAKSQAISAAASDATTKANNAKSQAISAAASDATTKANNAKSQAIAAAASDATTKANNAKAAAISAVTNGAGAAFDTLVEIQNAMATDSELSSAITSVTSSAAATASADATTKADAALAAAKVYADANDTDTNTWRGISNSVTSTSTSVSASSAAVKAAYDRSWPNTTYTATQMRDAVKTVDGSGSGLDADLLDGIQGSQLLRSDTADTASGHITLSGGFSGQSTLLSGAQNFDNIKTSGFYSLYSTRAGTNAPPFDYGTMISANNTASSAGMGMQLAHERLGNGMYVRGMNDTADTWSSWAEVWTSTTDGSGSGLDADLLDGQHASAFATSGHSHNYVTDNGYQLRLSSSNEVELFNGSGTLVDMYLQYSGGVNSLRGPSGSIIWHAGNDGSGSGLDADTVDGLQASQFLRSDTWASQNGGVNITKNIGTAITWTDNSSQLSLENTDAGWVGINFHRAGYTSNNIYHDGTNFVMDSSMTSSGDITAYSDERLKSDIVTIPNALDTVSKLRGVNYIKDGKSSTGVIAQEVEAVMPTIVHTASDEMGTKSVAYGNMMGVMIEAMKEMKTEMERLSEENKELRSMIKSK